MAATIKFLTAFFLFAIASLGFAGLVSRFAPIGATNDWGKSRTVEEITSTNHGITEYGIQRLPLGFGGGPVYQFICKADGTFRYDGEAEVEHKGHFTGTIPVEDFNRLAQFIRDSGYMELEYAYHSGSTDNPIIWTMVVANGQRKAIDNYNNSGPTRLWATEQLIYELLTKAEWGIADGAPGARTSYGEISQVASTEIATATIDWSKSRTEEESRSTNHGITEVGIERGECGNCPVYSFICKSDGTFSYKGVRHVERKGKFTGTIPTSDFDRLAQFIRDSEYMELHDAYLARTNWVVASADVWTMVTANHKRKVIHNSQNAGPTKLWAIEQLTDALLSKAQWDLDER